MSDKRNGVHGEVAAPLFDCVLEHAGGCGPGCPGFPVAVEQVRRALRDCAAEFPELRGLWAPTLSLAMPLPAGFSWCEKCAAAREAGHGCYR